MDRVMKPLLKMNANISGIDNNYTPLIIKPSTIKGINYQMELQVHKLKVLFYLLAYFQRSHDTYRI